MSTPESERDLRDALQSLLDAHGDHWQLAEHLVVMALERVGPDGIESVVWYWAPADQAAWKVTGLLEAASLMMDDDYYED